MNKGAQIVHFQFDGHPEVIQSHSWRLEMDVNMHRNRLGLPFYTKYKTIANYEPDPNPGEDLTTATSSQHDSDLAKPTPVSRPTRKAKTRQKTAQLPAVSQLLDEFSPAGNLPEAHAPGMDATLPDSLEQRNDVQENE